MGHIILASICHKVLINRSCSPKGTTTAGAQVAIKKKICTMPDDAFFPIKDMKTIEVRFGSNDDKLIGTGVMAGYATYKIGTVNNIKCTHESKLTADLPISCTFMRSRYYRVKLLN